MTTFVIFNVILFPFKLVLLILSYALKGILFFLGFIVMFLSGTCGKVISFVGFFIGIMTIINSVKIIKGIQADDYELWHGVGSMTLQWVVVMLACCLPAFGDAIADGLFFIGEVVNDFCLDLF